MKSNQIKITKDNSESKATSKVSCNINILEENIKESGISERIQNNYEI